MKLIRPSYEILTPIDGVQILKNIEVAGRTCYKSEDKITEDSATKFVAMLLGKHHKSVIEHQSLSVRFICDRGVSHEIVRHRLASFSQESTRYCNYSKDKFGNELTFIIPCWLDIPESQFKTFSDIAQVYFTKEFKENGINGLRSSQESIFLSNLLLAEKNYNTLIERGWTAQQARAILPNSLKTEIVVTANLREWLTIFEQRTAKAAHPQMRELMCTLLDELKTKIPVIFDGINYN